MKHSRTLLASLMALSGLCCSAAHAFDGWQVEETTAIAGKNSSWDYISLDAKANRLYLGRRATGLQVYDIANKKVLATIDGTPAASSNGATLMPEFDLGLSNNENGTITPFKLSTMQAMPVIKLGDELDSSHYDPATQRVVVNMASDKTGTDLIVLQAPSLAKIGSIRVTTKKPEHSEADGKGNYYMASRDENKVYRLDTKAMKITAEWPTPGCAATNGLALDVANQRIFLGCRGSATVKPSFAVMNAETGAIIFTAEIGGGNDAVVYDADLKRIFLGNGVNAQMMVVEQVNADTYKLSEALGTPANLRTLVMHPTTKKLYGMTAEGSADYAKKITTSVSPYYANTFFKDKFYVLTIGK
jgi:hypothetical protein